MSTNTISPKEEFFRTKLIPAGQLTEVYLHHMSQHRRGDVSRILFENLGLTSAFAISPSTPSDKKLFAALSSSVQQLINMLRDDLMAINTSLAINTSRHTAEQSRAFRASQASIVDRLKPHLASLLELMQYTPEGREKWLETVTATSTPLTTGREYKKWRTFVRNLDFDLNMQSLGLREAAKALPVLGSRQGKAEAPTLWRKCFDTVWTDGTELIQGGPYLPAGVSVKSTSTGLLEVTHSYDHRKVLKKSLVVLTAGVPEVTARLEVAVFSKTCHYTELEQTIAEVAAWVEAQSATAEATQVLITKVAEAAKVDALRAKLASTFSPEELELLAKVSALPGAAAKAKPAARPRARKT